MTRLLAATGNAHKLEELRRLLAAPGLEVVGFADIEPPPEQWTEPPSRLVESGRTFLDNARLKALHASRHQDLPVVADDSGLVVDALDGAPGVLSARWGGPGLSDRERFEVVLRDCAAVPDAKRTARYVASVVLARGGEIVAEADGTCEVTLLRAPRGSGGFGYDPIALVEELGKTMAELTPSEKDSVSHRARALRALADRVPELRRDA